MEYWHISLSPNHVLGAPPLFSCRHFWVHSIIQTHIRDIQLYRWCYFSIPGQKASILDAKRLSLSHRTPTHSTPASHRLNSLEQQASSLIALSVAPSTKKKYDACINTYTMFCKSTDMNPTLISERTLILFATELSSKMAHSNICCHIAAVKYFAHVHGFDLDITPFNRLYRLLRGIKRSQSNKFRKPPRVPITPPTAIIFGQKLVEFIIQI